MYISIDTDTHLLLRKSDDPEQRRLPSAIMAILSPRRSASSLQWYRVLEYNICTFVPTLPCSSTHMKCVVRSIVLPFLCLIRTSQVALLAYGSMPEVGSSSTTNWEPPIRAMATLQTESAR